MGCRAALPMLLLLVSWLAFAPAAPEAMSVPHLDKLKHLAAFSALASVAHLGWLHARTAAWWTAWGLLVFGVFIEAVQSQIPTRNASAADVVADAVGIVLGLGLVRAVGWLSKTRAR
jgi:VanZ family protein